MNPYLAQIALGMAALLMLRGRFLKSLAVGFTHYSVQTLLIALAGEGAATGAPHLPLVVQLIFFPITMLPERYGILIPFGPLLNSGFVGLVSLAALRALDRKVETPDLGGAAPPPDWLHSFRASTTEAQNIQDGARYWVSTGKILWGIWTVTVAARGFLGIRKMIYAVCVVPPDPTGKFPVPSLQAAFEAKRIKWVPVSSFTEEDGRALEHFVSNVVQVEPRERWDLLITRELQARFKPLAEAQAL